MGLTMKSQSRGFISIEILVVLIVIALAIVQGSRLYGEYLSGLNQQVAAQQQHIVAEAGSKYIKDNFATVLAVATPTAPALITVTMLKNTKYLPAGFADQNVFGQSYQVLARRTAVTSNQLETLVITTGGEAADEIDIRKVAQIIGAQGGYISSDNTAIARGLAWEIPLVGFGVSPGGGHLATALFFQDGVIANDYLYRNAIPGQPELNVMNTTLGMGGNDINNAGNIDANGDITAQNISAQDSLNVDGNAEVDGQIYTSGWLRTRGDGGWFSEKWNGGWYMTDSTWVRSWLNKNVYTAGEIRGGVLRSENRTVVGEYLQLGTSVTEGTACSPNGLLAKKSNGQAISCVNGAWYDNATATYVVTASNTGGSNTSARVDCGWGRVISGGGTCQAPNATYLRTSVPDGNGWRATCDDYNYRTTTVVVYAVCEL